MLVKAHDFKTASHRPFDPEQEPDTERTMIDNWMEGALRYADLPYMGYRAGLSTNPKLIVDHYQFISYRQAMAYVAHLAQLLQGSGLKQGDRVVIYAKNSPLWLLSDLAIMFAGGVSVPLYDTLGLDNIVYCANLVQAKCIFVSQEYVPNVLAVLDKMPKLRTVVSLDAVQAETLKQQTRKVVVQLVGGHLIDDTSSMFSISSKKSASPDDVDEPLSDNSSIDFSKLDSLIDARGNDQIKLLELGNVALDAPSLEKAKSFLEKLQKTQTATPDSLNSVIFTSGTSGRPKAILMTNKNLLMGMASMGCRFVPYHLSDNGHRSSFVSYLPLAHVFERACEHGTIRRGHLIYYSSGSIKNLTKDIALAKPTIMYGVPRVYAKIHQSVMDKLHKSSIMVRAIFQTAYALKRLFINTTGSFHRLPLVDSVFGSIRQALGGNLEFLVSGSSALPEEVRKFLEACSGAKVTSGYGLSEASSAGSYNFFNQKYNTPHQLGFTSAQMQGKLVDRSDACEFSLESTKIGELHLKGPAICAGYVDGEWGKTKPLVDADGWYATGDLVHAHEDGTMSFVRRVGLVVKLQQGEFVDLEAVETVLEHSGLINVAFAHAEASKAAVVAFVSVDSKVLLERVGKETFNGFINKEIDATARVQGALFAEGDKLIRASGLKGFNVPKAYYIHLDVDWSTNPEYFTPSQKKKHGPFIKHHSKQLQQLWQIAESRDSAQKTLKKPLTLKKSLVVLALLLFAMAFLLFRQK